VNSTFNKFFKSEAFAGLLLIICAIIALIWANSPWASSYTDLKHLPVKLGVGDWTGKLSFEHLVNDGLMVLFFVLVGLEIKREVLTGELRQPRQAMLAIVAAVGGMVVPALIFLAFNLGTTGARGWGVPMATDIAFALGMLALLGSRVPLALKVFLTALAIVDDLGAVVVIAIFYTSSLNLTMLALAAGTWLLACLANLLGVVSLGVYGVLGLLLWAFTLQSGVHATVAGVLLALTIPITTKAIQRAKNKQVELLLPNNLETETDQREARLQDLEDSINQTQSPLYQLEHMLHPWTTYLVLPVFALLNAGLSLQSSGQATGQSMGISGVTIGVFFGLLLGKPIGVFAASWLAVRFGIASLPSGVTWGAVFGVSILAGIGFTMALFIASLAFGTSLELEQAKLGVLLASTLAAILGLLLLSRILNRGHSSVPQVKNV
jgi:Na+:H+ antiporter, NhaA family